MRTVTLLAFLLVGLTNILYTYAWEPQVDDVDTVDGYDTPALDLFSAMKRKSAMAYCARWGDFCRPDAKIKYAQCCDGLRCMCGHFWTQGKCQCKSNGTFGK